jgi:hypothetical protein
VTTATATLTSEVPFTLPRGYVGPDGTLRRDGTMRPARASDELAVLRDAAVREDQAYATVLLLARVVAFDDLDVTPAVVEDLLAADFEHLVLLFERLNSPDHVGSVECPHCSNGFDVDLSEISDRRLGK